MELLAFVAVAVVFFVFGVLFGRKNKQKVQAALDAANDAHDRVFMELDAAKDRIAQLTAELADKVSGKK